jgi:riboflavin kinase / FMN adenylyltransferase
VQARQLTGRHVVQQSKFGVIGRPVIAADIDILQPAVIVDATVEHGRKFGRAMGFPTANFSLANAPRLRHGVYASRSRISDGRWIEGVASVGENFTVGTAEPHLKVWLFDFDEDLYGQRIQTVLEAFLRPELKCDSWEWLAAQMVIDVDDAQRVHSVNRKLLVDR